MKKGKIIGGIIVIVIFIALIVFACTYDYKDTHLRVDGVRVRIEEGTIIADCDEADAAHCVEYVVVNDEQQKLEYTYQNFKENGYPESLSATINGKEFYHKDGLNIEENYSYDYQFFSDVTVMGDYIVMTIRDGYNNRTTSLYVIDTLGNIILQEYEIDEDNMKIDDSGTDYITVTDNKIIVKASRLDGNNYYFDGKSVCYTPLKTVVKAEYTYTLKNGKYSKKQTAKTTAKAYREDVNMICPEDAISID